MGTGEVTRYLATYGSARVSKAALLAPIPPFLLKTDDNPDGVDAAVFDDIKAAVIADRPAYFKNFLDNFYNIDVLAGTRVSDQAWQNSFNIAVAASAHAAHACVDTWLTDFRDDLPMIDGYLADFLMRNSGLSASDSNRQPAKPGERLSGHTLSVKAGRRCFNAGISVVDLPWMQVRPVPTIERASIEGVS